MDEHNQMKDDPTRQDPYTRHASGEDTPPPSDADGRRYTTPDGSHGFVYDTRAAAAESRSRRYRSALIAVSAVLVTVLAVGGCLVGTWMAARNLHLFDHSDEVTTDASDEIGTSDGLVIADGESVPEATPEDDRTTRPDDGTSAEVVTMDADAQAPTQATIHKLPAKRTDADRDGKADLAYDASGNVLTSAGDTHMTVATVVSRVAASVVEITTETIVQSGYIGQYVTSGAGSGVIIAEEGFIVTNHHVINGANTITVSLNDGTRYAARLVGTDEQTDIAVLWIDTGDRALTVASMGSSYDLVVGEDILAIGNPLGSLGGTVTEGMISATAREISVSGTNMTLLQVSAPINPGNSGGGLFNLAGELVGVVNAKMSSEEIEGLGFAIPSDVAYTVICELIDHGYVRGRPSLGITLTEVSSWSGSRYVCVNDRDHDILAYEDLIIAADGVRISTLQELTTVVRGHSVGDTIELTVYRGNKQLTLEVPIVEAIPAE